MWFFVFSINFARTREGRPARRKLTELLVKSKKTLVTDPAAIFFVFYPFLCFNSSMLHLVWSRKKRQNTNPHPDGNFFDDRFGLGILRDKETAVNPHLRKWFPRYLTLRVDNIRRLNSVTALPKWFILPLPYKSYV